MVQIHLIPASEFRRANMSKTDARKFATKYGIRGKRIENLSAREVVDLIIAKQNELKLAEQQEKLNASKRGITADILAFRNKETTAADLLQKIQEANSGRSTFRPKFIQLFARKLWLNPDLPGLTSEQAYLLDRYLGNNRCYNRLVLTDKEEKNYYNTIRSALVSIDRIDLFDQLHFHVQPIFTDKELDMAYYMNGGYFDFASHVIATHTEEPEPVFVPPDNKVRLKCILECIYSQLKDGARTNKRKKALYEFNERDFIGVSDLDEVAEKLEICITVYDLECKIWHQFDHSPKNRRSYSTKVSVIANNLHAYNLKRNTNPDAEKFIIHSPGVSLTHVDYKPPDVYRGKFSIVNDHLLFNNERYIQEVKPGIYYDSPKIDDFTPVIEFLVKRAIYPSILSSRGMIIAVSFELGKGQRVQLRNSMLEHPYVDLVPSDYSYTINSCALYLFRNFIKTSLFKVVDPVLTKVFKSLCVPTIFMKSMRIDSSKAKKNRKYIYMIDINKAYRSFASNIGVFSDEPPSVQFVPHPLYPDTPLRPGIYNIEGRWMTHEELEYDLHRSQREVICNYAIYYDSQTNVLDEFADALYNDRLPIKDIEHKKEMFNSLIGKFNPHPQEQSYTIILKTELDLSRFVASRGKEIHYVQKIQGEDNAASYVAEFTYGGIAYKGTNLPHISAQIIQRCKLAIRKTTDKLIDALGDKVHIIGSMTDSLVFYSTVPVDFAALGIPISDNIGDFKLTQSDSFVSLGVGRYALYNARNEDGTPSKKRKEILLKFMGENDPSKRCLDFLIELVKDLSTPRNEVEHPEPPISPLSTKQHLLFIGEAGVGKSRYILNNYLNRHAYLRLSPTGVSAYSIRASTIHSYFCLGHRGDRSVLDSYNKMTVRKRAKLMSVSTLIIDECYTASADVMEKVSNILKLICRSYKPFGDKQLIMFGDDRQLHSVGGSFMTSPIMDLLDVETHVLEYNVELHPRLKPDYRAVCNFLRQDRSALELQSFIEELQLTTSKTPILDSTSVYYTNRLVDARNKKELEAMPGKFVNYSYKSESGEVVAARYKRGMRIMLTRNKAVSSGLYNGRIGKLLSVTSNTPQIELTDKAPDGSFKTRIVARKGYFHFVPAYAITIHKVQGLTLDSINIYFRKEELKKEDATRLLYVALTRVSEPSKVYIELID
jgi:hypothetical protein